MRALIKWLLVAAVALAALLLGGGLALSGEFQAVRSVRVDAPADKVYALIVDPREWKRWSVWNRRDPDMAITYSGPPSGAGAVWEWKSRSEGDGRMTFTAADPSRRLAFELYFPDFGTTSTGVLELAPAGSATQVTWTMNGNMGRNPVYRWMALFMDRMVGPDFEAGLANLKALAEKS
jgi:uncharacterized protein YndB with AHSA1/START domain